ncbi:hypothetical protein JVU11DRAFT_1080 [Chiua virens]|nr:hypothetical protein JVU11DRAFT_1080 [Chiua virens]
MSSYSSAYFNNFSWPSLYSPATEVGFLGPAIRPGGYYLTNSTDVFRFTLYWTLIFHLPFNFIAGLYAFFNFLFPPGRIAGDASIVLESPATREHAHTHRHSRSHSYNTQPHSHSRSQSQTQSQTLWRVPSPPPSTAEEGLKPASPPQPPGRRSSSRWTFSLLVLLAFLGFSLMSAVVGATVLAFVLLWVYQSGGFYMSTYVHYHLVFSRAQLINDTGGSRLCGR